MNLPNYLLLLQVEYQVGPFATSTLQGLNVLRQPFSGMAANLSMHSKMVVVGAPISAPAGDSSSELMLPRYFANLLSIANGNNTAYRGEPFSSLYLPVFDSFESNRTAVASLLVQIFWTRYFNNLLPPTDNGIHVVLKSCKGSHTMEIHGTSVEFLGTGDLHDRRFDSEVRRTNFQNVQSIPDSTKEGLKLNKEFCPIEIEVYPSMVR
jgi:hypothetical protein